MDKKYFIVALLLLSFITNISFATEKDSLSDNNIVHEKVVSKKESTTLEKDTKYKDFKKKEQLKIVIYLSLFQIFTLLLVLIILSFLSFKSSKKLEYIRKYLKGYGEVMSNTSNFLQKLKEEISEKIDELVNQVDKKYITKDKVLKGLKHYIDSVLKKHETSKTNEGNNPFIEQQKKKPQKTEKLDTGNNNLPDDKSEVDQEKDKKIKELEEKIKELKQDGLIIKNAYVKLKNTFDEQKSKKVKGKPSKSNNSSKSSSEVSSSNSTKENDLSYDKKICAVKSCKDNREYFEKISEGEKEKIILVKRGSEYFLTIKDDLSTMEENGLLLSVFFNIIESKEEYKFYHITKLAYVEYRANDNKGKLTVKGTVKW